MKAGIIGLGHGIRVLLNSFKINKIEVYGVASKNYQKAKKISEDKKISKVYKNWKDLIIDKKIDIVAIAVPAVYQLEMIKACIENNKIIFCEKPIGIDYKKIKNLFTILTKYKNFFLVDYIFPEHKGFVKFNKIIKKRELTKSDFIKVIFNTQSYINKNNLKSWKVKKNEGGGLINLYLSHIVDYLVIFFGKIKKIKINNLQERKFIMNCSIEFYSGPNAEVLIDSNNPKKIHSIDFFSKEYKLSLVNNGGDYSKDFKLKKTEFTSDNKKILKEVLFNDFVKKYKKDSRVILTSRIIKKFQSKGKIIDLKKNIERYKYNEFILNKVRDLDSN